MLCKAPSLPALGRAVTGPPAWALLAVCSAPRLPTKLFERTPEAEVDAVPNVPAACVEVQSVMKPAGRLSGDVRHCGSGQLPVARRHRLTWQRQSRQRRRSCCCCCCCGADRQAWRPRKRGLNRENAVRCPTLLPPCIAELCRVGQHGNKVSSPGAGASTGCWLAELLRQRLFPMESTLTRSIDFVFSGRRRSRNTETEVGTGNLPCVRRRQFHLHPMEGQLQVGFLRSLAFRLQGSV